MESEEGSEEKSEEETKDGTKEEVVDVSEVEDCWGKKIMGRFWWKVLRRNGRNRWIEE